MEHPSGSLDGKNVGAVAFPPGGATFSICIRL
jgi:hypothetical protein